MLADRLTEYAKTLRQCSDKYEQLANSSKTPHESKVISRERAFIYLTVADSIDEMISDEEK